MNDLNDIRWKILDAKESRWNFQKELLTIYHQPIISFKFNIPSWPKISDEIQQAFYFSLTDFQTFLRKLNINFKLLDQKTTVLGPEAFFISSLNADELKQMAISFEEEHIIGRLIDIDILDISGSVIDRTIKRRCFLCNKIAIDCMREQHHSQTELRDFFDHLVKNYLKEK
ncbi:MAG TPA: citrate lyase holo-[acyl-carrier protein] synthase [Candidatus Bathyarchaeia archaeon]|nr:citrate lyase holo-[acyl-carrier protein] synthase [Candidatus Bathyarchaeia archaeon]